MGIHMRPKSDSFNAPNLNSRIPAFTMVELLVVITIVTLLLSLLLPAIGKAKEAANRVVCLSQLRQISVAGLTYANDNRFALPACDAARPTAWMDQSVQLPSTYPSTVVKMGVQRLWDNNYIPMRKKNSSNALINDYRLALCPGKVDHYNPAVLATQSYVTHPSSYLDIGWVSYDWAASNYFEVYPSPAVGGASFGI